MALMLVSCRGLRQHSLSNHKAQTACSLVSVTVMSAMLSSVHAAVATACSSAHYACSSP